MLQTPDTIYCCHSRIQSNVEGLYLTDSVPFSCCNPHSPRPCLQSRLSDPYAHPLFDPRQPNLNLWPQGCHEVLLDHLQGLAGTLGSVLAITFLLQVRGTPGCSTSWALAAGPSHISSHSCRCWCYLACGTCRQRWRDLVGSSMGTATPRATSSPEGSKIC